MSVLPHVSEPRRRNFFLALRRTRISLLVVLLVLFGACLTFGWLTRDVMTHLSLRSAHPGKPGAAPAENTIVDQSPWETARALAQMAVTSEEIQHAREAERLADHSVDQAFAAALRQATLKVEHQNLSGQALAFAQKVDQLQAVVKQDQATVQQLTAANMAGPKPASQPADASSGNTDLDIAQAQLGLDSDQLEDARGDLARISGDQRAEIQAELTSREAAMKKYDSQAQGEGQIAVLSSARYGTLWGRVRAWFKQNARYALIVQAQQQAEQLAKTLTQQHNALETTTNQKTSAGAAAQEDRSARLSAIRDLSVERQLLNIYDDRIQTEQQLAGVYAKWAAQVELQHRIVLHLILNSVAVILAILICMIVGDTLVRRVMAFPRFDRRQIQTLRMVLELTVQVMGTLLIILVVFGAPHETPTILGLTTAALTIALQDFVLAFFGWFVLMGKRGIRVGDWVEINGVTGEVTELGVMTTTLLETGNVAEKGYPTGRHISFMNSFAIRGQYFNFSTAGQWMMDEITVALPADADTQTTVQRILQLVQEDTRESSRIAELEWKGGVRHDSLSKFRTDPAVNLRPSGAGIEVEIRYVTRATERFEMRNRLYRQIFELLHEQPAADGTATVLSGGAD